MRLLYLILYIWNWIIADILEKPWFLSGGKLYYNANGRGRYVNVCKLVSDITFMERALLFDGTDNEKALKCLLWVLDNCKYLMDMDGTGKDMENWRLPSRTLSSRHGDCEDLHMLLYCILRHNGIATSKLRLVCGEVNNVKGGTDGHVWLIYFCQVANKWVVLDVCYNPNLISVPKRLSFADEPSYAKVAFMWNEEACWLGKKGLDKRELAVFVV